MSTTQGFVCGVKHIAARFHISYKLAAAIIVRLGIAQKVGKSWVVRCDDLHMVETALRGFGYPIPPDVQHEEGVGE